MVSLIDRNKNLDAYDVVLLTEQIPVFSRVNGVTVDCTNYSDPEEMTQQLMSRLDTVRTQIKEYLQTYRQARGRRRNHDPLSREFIMNMFCAWQMFRYGDDKPRLDPLPPEDRRLFARFLAAAWRDAGFPLTDHRGSSRELWKTGFLIESASCFPTEICSRAILSYASAAVKSHRACRTMRQPFE